MPTPDVRRGRSPLPRRAAALACALTLLLTQSLFGATGASALPTGAYWYSLLQLPQAWRITEGAGVTVAVVDKGVDARVGDLKGQVLRGLDLTGQDPGAQREEPSTHGDGFGHGTDMATLIAGTGNGAGLKGVAPKAKILPVDASTDGTFSNADIAHGVTWATDHGARVIDLSLGGPNPCDPVVAQALRHAYERDVIVVVAAGDSPGPVYAPANCPGALAIAASDANVKPWVKSASGPEIDFTAPGFGLVNELLTNRLSGPNPGNSGTSQAAAIAAGTFALLRARFPKDTARQIVTRALYNVHNGLGAGHQGDRAGDALGYGMVLPRYALTDAPPAGAANPIYDRWARDFAASSTGSSTAPAGSSSAPASPSDGPAAGSTPAASADSGGGSRSSALGVVIVAVLIVVLVIAVLGTVVVRRGRRPGGPSGFPPPPGPGR